MKICTLFVICATFKFIFAAKVTETPEMVSVMKITKIPQVSGASCVFDYSLSDEFQDLPLPSWLRKWDDVLFNTLCSTKYDVQVSRSSMPGEIAKQLLFSLASGYEVDRWQKYHLRKRFDEGILEQMMENLWETGNIRGHSDEMIPKQMSLGGSPTTLSKRITIFRWGQPRWQYDSQNQARVSVLSQLAHDLGEKGDVISNVSRPSLCMVIKGEVGCLSWTGEANRIKNQVAADVIKSGIGSRQLNTYVSCRSSNVLKDYAWRSACLSNRHNDCT